MSAPTPQFKDHEAHLRAIIDAALRAVDPSRCTTEACRASPPPSGDFAVLAAGKAAAAMLEGLRGALPGEGSPIAKNAIGEWTPSPKRGDGDPGPERAEFVIVPDGGRTVPGALVGDHPLPSDRNTVNGRNAKRFVEKLAAAPKPDGLVVLLSGGASALLTSPVLGLDPDEYRGLIEAMLRAGRTIQDINCVRKHCDAIKGGRFARFLGRLWCHVYVLSDVIGDPLDAIGSGPFAPDPTTFEDAAAVLMAMPTPQKTWPSIWKYVSRGVGGATNDTPKPGDPIFDRVRHVVVANNATAMEAAAEEAVRLGYRVAAKKTGVQGEAAKIGRAVAAYARDLIGKGPVCLLAGGETTVAVGAAAGRGGRNQELALAAALENQGVAGWALAAFATDGVDGPTDAAGAIVSGETCPRASATGTDPQDALARHDSYAFFEKAGGHIKTGLTGTNVNDLAIALVY